MARKVQEEKTNRDKLTPNSFLALSTFSITIPTSHFHAPPGGTCSITHSQGAWVLWMKL